jgi:integrase
MEVKRMPRRNLIPTYQRHASGQAKVRINGRDIYLGPHGSDESKQRYEELVRKILTDREKAELAQRVQLSTALTVAELTSKYLVHARSYYVKAGRPTTEYGNIFRALTPLLEQFGYELVTAFSPLKLMKLQDDLVSEGKIIRDQVNRRIDRIRRCFKWGVSRLLVPSEIYESLRTVEGLREGRTIAREGKGGKPVSIAHIEAVLPHVDRRIRAMILTQLYSGMRPGEVIQMTMRTIDMTGSNWIYTPPRSKSQHHGKPRRVYLGPKAQEVLREWLRTELDEPLFQPCEAENERSVERRTRRATKLWPSHIAHQKAKKASRPRRRLGKQYTVTSYRRAITRACELAEIPAWGPHSLRHTAASNIRREFGEESARIVLGHARIDTTALYGEADQAKASEAMAKIG